ncbi:PH domain containing protein [Zostera marina]|uniref:PH domain containing protein n=1 Tax=Zostera marina TaxID=29655 RepID=A0A0K9PY35_ZOSMR|nr:PH domain containing protein [Zostera marina]
METDGSPVRSGCVDNSLERIKQQLSLGEGKCLLQGPLLKRSETLRKWNERWVILNPTTGKMEYKTRRNEPFVRGTILFDSSSIITLSPLNFQGLPKYDGCCFYIGNPLKKEYFLCAETPNAARAWVSTLNATQLVLKAHKEAVNSLGSGGSERSGIVATAVSAANSAALEAKKEIEAALKVSMRSALATMTNKSNDDEMDDLAIMKETLRVKDEELHHLSNNLRTCDCTIKDLADKLTDTAEAAECAASAVHVMDEERRLACKEIERLSTYTVKQLNTLTNKLRESDEKVTTLSKENELLLKQKESALQEAHLWRTELGKAREHAVISEAAVLRADERAKVSQAAGEDKLNESAEKQMAFAKEREELLAYVNILQLQIQRQESNTKQVINETSESCSDGNVDKACLIDFRNKHNSDDDVVNSVMDGIDIKPISDAEWSGFQPTNARIADVREILSDEGATSLDIPVVTTEADHKQP